MVLWNSGIRGLDVQQQLQSLTIHPLLVFQQSTEARLRQSNPTTTNSSLLRACWVLSYRCPVPLTWPPT